MRKTLIKSIMLLAALAIGLTNQPSLALADDDDHDRAADNLNAGLSMPMTEIIDKIEKTYAAKVINVELLERGEAHIYKIYLLDNDGNLQHLFLNPRDGRVIFSAGIRINPHRQGQ